MNIAFCSNRLGLIGLGVTLTSLIRNSSDSHRLNIWFLCAGLSHRDKQLIENLLRSEKYRGVYQFIDFDPFYSFGSFRSLHGDWTTYGRLLLPEIIASDRVLYLDSDLLIELDVLELDGFDFHGKPLAAVHGGPLSNALENKFYLDVLGLEPDQASFNAGILLFNLIKWRENNLKERCLELARQYPMELLSCDQTLLNAVFAGNFSKLPPSYNCAWLPSDPKPEGADKMILHFIGSPKPWDPFGRWIHRGFKSWNYYLTREWQLNFQKVSKVGLKRFWNIRRSYIRVIKKMLRKSNLYTN